MSDLAVMYSEVIGPKKDLKEPAYLSIPHILTPYPSAVKSMIGVYIESLFFILNNNISMANIAVRNTRRAKQDPVGHIIDQASAEAQIVTDNSKIDCTDFDNDQKDWSKGLAAEFTHLLHGTYTGDFADLERTRNFAETRLLKLREISDILGFDYVALEEKHETKKRSHHLRIDETL
ncbi:MAG: hypothetical protein R3D88_00655 [Alphaproteobacteria bacterium]